MKLEMIVATWFQPEWHRCVASWHEHADCQFPLSEIVIAKKNVVEAYQSGFENSRGEILGFVHDDVLIHENNWDWRVWDEFKDPQVGVVGFAGAPGFCHPGLNPSNYSWNSMGRIGFRSNMRDAEVHGERFTGECNVTILDGFAMFVRREVLEKAGGWPVGSPVGYFMYDAWLCCAARKMGYRIRMVGVECDHLGGRSLNLNPNRESNLEESCRWIYEQFQGILPSSVEP